MKKVLKHTLSFLLAFTVLFASTGVVIVSHVCAASKEADVSLFQRDGCCSNPGMSHESMPVSDGHLKKECCQLSVNLLKIDVTSLLKSVSQITGLLVIPATTHLFSVVPQLSFSNPQLHKPDLPGYGKDFLFSIHLLLI